MPLENRLLAALPSDVVAGWRPGMKTVKLAYGQVLRRAHAVITEVYFPLDCMISVTVTTLEGRTAEAGAVGSREMVGVNAFMGGRESNQTEYVTQLAGSAVVVPSRSVCEAFDRHKAVRDVMLRYTQAYIAHLSQNVACNRLHTIDQRLARWLLECSDRVQTEALPISHEFLAEMLGVRRAGVSVAASRFQDRGWIEMGRRRVRILDRPGVERAACDCHRLLLDEYDRLLGPVARRGATKGR